MIFNLEVLKNSDFAAMANSFQTQLAILEAVEVRFESRLFEIKQLVQADLFDSEIDSAEELVKAGFYRAAGVILGVVLESHLNEVIQNHRLSIKKQKPTINDYNETLKSNNVIEVPTWRFIQHLGDLRNLCSHNTGTEPSKGDIEDLLKGVEKITKTVY